MWSFRVVALILRMSASALTNSVYTMSAPNSWHISLKEWSVTSSIGASITGRGPRSMFPIFMDAKLRIFSEYRPGVFPKECGKLLKV